MSVFWVFNFVSFTRILFRATDLNAAADYLKAMSDGVQVASEYSYLGMCVLLGAALLHWGWRNSWSQSLWRLREVPVPAQALALVILTYAVMALSSRQAPFVYFMF